MRAWGCGVRTRNRIVVRGGTRNGSGSSIVCTHIPLVADGSRAPRRSCQVLDLGRINSGTVTDGLTAASDCSSVEFGRNCDSMRGLC